MDTMNIGEAIKLFRKEKGLTQKELGERIGISAISVRKYESGDRNPSNTTLQVIADVLGIDKNQLLSLNDETNSIEDILQKLSVAFDGSVPYKKISPAPLKIEYNNLSLVEKINTLNELGKQKVESYIDDLHENLKYTKEGE